MTSSPDPFIYNYKFSAVTSGSDENKTFWKWTPSGGIELSSIRDELFEVGKEYYVDFSLFVPVPAPAMSVEEEIE
jgi:hypothetical protein